MTGRLEHAIMVNSDPSFSHMALARSGHRSLRMSRFSGQEAGAHGLPLLS